MGVLFTRLPLSKRGAHRRLSSLSQPQPPELSKRPMAKDGAEVPTRHRSTRPREPLALDRPALPTATPPADPHPTPDGLRPLRTPRLVE